MKKRFTEEEKEILSMAANGVPYFTIADKYGLEVEYVMWFLRRFRRLITRYKNK